MWTCTVTAAEIRVPVMVDISRPSDISLENRRYRVDGGRWTVVDTVHFSCQCARFVRDGGISVPRGYGPISRSSDSNECKSGVDIDQYPRFHDCQRWSAILDPVSYYYTIVIPELKT